MNAPTQKDFILSPQEKKQLEPLYQYLTPEHVEGKKELVINKPKRVGYEDFGGMWQFMDAPELDLNTLQNITRILADLNRVDYNVGNPILSLRIPGGHRCQIVGGDQTASSYSFTIRLAQAREFTLDNYDIPAEQKQAIIQAVKSRKTLLIAGGTGSGKTSFLNALMPHIPETDRLVTIEDVRELRVPHENWVGLVFSNAKDREGNRGNILPLLNATLRMRPDRIILGEIRKENAFTFCSAINTGHRGSMATIHANDPKTALDAVINRVMLNGDMAESAIGIMRRQLQSDIYGVIQLERKVGGVVGAALCIAGSAFAQEETQTTTSRGTIYDALATWQTEVEFGYSSENGNTNSTELETAISFERDWTKWGLSGGLNMKHETNSGARSSEEYELDLEGKYNLDPRTFIFAAFDYEKDLFSGYNYRIEETVGLGHHLIKTDTMSLDVKGGVGAQHTETDTTPKNKETSMVLKPEANFEWLINNYVTFSQTAKSTIGSELTKTELETALKSKLTENLFLKASYEIEHANSAPAGKKKTDTTLGVSLDYEFK